MPTPTRLPLRLTCRLTLAVLAVSVTLGVATGCAITTDDPPVRTVTVGLLHPSETGADARNGAQLAVDLVNGAQPDLALPLAADRGLPGLDGATLALAVADTRGEPAAAEAALGDLLDAGAVAVVAADRADVVEIAAAYANRREVPIVDGATSAGYLLDIGLEWYFRTGPADRTLVDGLLAHLGAATGSGAPAPATVLTPAGGRGADVAALVADQAATAGLALTDPVTVGTSVAAELTTRAPRVLVAVAPEPADAPALLAEIEGWLAASTPPAADAAPPLLAGAGPGFAGVLEDAPAGLRYASAYSSELAARQPLAKAVAARYQEQFGQPMSESAARSFTATLTLAMAIDAAGDTAAGTIRAALRQLSIPATRIIMPWTGIRFGEDGQNELAAAVVVRTGVDGPEVVHPPELAIP